MKYSLLLPLLSYGITAAMNTSSIVLKDFKAYRDNNRIIASAQIKGSGEIYSAEKNTTDDIFSLSHMIPVKDIFTQGFEYHSVDNKPEVLAAFAKEIAAFQNSQNKTIVKKKSNRRLLFLQKK